MVCYVLGCPGVLVVVKGGDSVLCVLVCWGVLLYSDVIYLIINCS